MDLEIAIRPGHLLAVAGTSIAVFLSGLFWFRPWKSKRSDRFLSAIFACTALSQASFLATPGFLLDAVPHLSRISYPALFVMAPVFLFYIRSLTEPGFRMKARDLVHFLPAVVFTGLFAPFYFNSGEHKISFDTRLSTPAYLRYIDDYVWFAILAFVMVYFITILGLISRHQRRIRETFSDLSRIKLSWITRMMLSIIFCWCLIAVVSLLGIFRSSPLMYIDTTPGFVFGFLMFVGYKVITQPSIYSDASVEEPDDRETQREWQVDDERMRQYEKGLLKSMEEDRLYADPELTLPALAARLGMPRNALSALINRSTGANFYTFVNTYRVEEVKRLLLRPDKRNLTLLALAMEAGFNSKATFNAVFKAITKMTPTQYMSSMGSEKEKAS